MPTNLGDARENSNMYCFWFQADYLYIDETGVWQTCAIKDLIWVTLQQKCVHIDAQQILNTCLKQQFD